MSTKGLQKNIPQKDQQRILYKRVVNENFPLKYYGTTFHRFPYFVTSYSYTFTFFIFYTFHAPPPCNRENKHINNNEDINKINLPGHRPRACEIIRLIFDQSLKLLNDLTLSRRPGRLDPKSATLAVRPWRLGRPRSVCPVGCPACPSGTRSARRIRSHT